MIIYHNMCLENLQDTFMLLIEQSLYIINIVFSKDTNIFNNEQTAFLMKQTFLSLRRKIIRDHCFLNGHMVTVKSQKYNIKHDRTLTITESFKELKRFLRGKIKLVKHAFIKANSDLKY